MDSQQLLDLLWLGRLTVIPLGLGSILVLAIVFERVWRYRGIERGTRQLTRDSVERLVRRDVGGARALCEYRSSHQSRSPSILPLPESLEGVFHARSCDARDSETPRNRRIGRSESGARTREDASPTSPGPCKGGRAPFRLW